MEAKDTVVTKKQMKEALQKANCPEVLIEKIGEDLLLWWKTGWLQEIFLTQAEISFKAGVREVVKWIESNGHQDSVIYSEWQKKCKEWGIEDGS